MARGATHRNTLRNTSYSIILAFLEGQDEEWTPTTISRELKIPRGTVNAALFKARKLGTVICRKVGKYAFYSATKRQTDDFLKLFKKYPTKERYQIHGLTLKLNDDFQSIINKWPLGGERRLGVIQWFVLWGECKVSFQLSRETLMVYGKFGESPLDYDGWLLFLAFTEGVLVSRGLPGIRGRLGRWEVRQYGFNQDWRRFRNDSPTNCVSMQGFDLWFARVYDKKSLGVLREEIHSREVKSLDEFCALVGESLSATRALNFLDTVALSMNSLMKSNYDLGRRVAELTDMVKQQGETIASLLGEDRKGVGRDRKDIGVR